MPDLEQPIGDEQLVGTEVDRVGMRSGTPLRRALAALVEAHDQEPPMLTEAEWEAARDALKQTEGLGKDIQCWVEADLAIAYAEAACKDCQNGDCELIGDEHDLSVYWNLDQVIRDRMVEQAADMFDNSSEPEVAHELLADVAERYATGSSS